MASELENFGDEKQTQTPEISGEVKEQHSYEEPSHLDVSKLQLEDLLEEAEKLVNKENSPTLQKQFNEIKEAFQHLIDEDIKDKKHTYADAGNDPETFSYQNPFQSKFNTLNHLFKDKIDAYHKEQERHFTENLETRKKIIENLKNLYTNTAPGTNLFRAIREIKEAWGNAGQVAKSEFKNLNNDYFHHLNQFYMMLDYNKEYREQEYAHNLEKRLHIIARAKELQSEEMVQKALNELQYLHKLWKEEAEPVAEEYRDKTWEEFKEISNKIHERKAELIAKNEAEQQENLVKKNEIIKQIKTLSSPEKEPNHNYWQNAIKKVEDLRNDFLRLGNAPKNISNQNWSEFKDALRNFNSLKNSFYRNLKGSQIQNLELKKNLIQTAKDNQDSEDWETAVPLFKKLQEDWKKIGHVPKNQTNKVWDEFRNACNHFFDNFRQKGTAGNDDWKENYKNKAALLEELKAIGEEEGSIEKIEHIKSTWNTIGKVPKDKLSINNEFNKVLRDKLRLNKVNALSLKEEGLSETQLTDKARKIKNQVADLEAEISKIENNLSFFSNPNRENPLLKDTYAKLDEKKAQLDEMKANLHNIISENHN